MARLKLSPPWIILYNKMKAFFKQDPDIHVGYDDGEKKIVVYVDNAKKAEALSKWLLEEVEYGNVKVKILVVPANGETYTETTDVSDVFEGNNALNCIKNVNVYGFDMTFVIFNAVVVQYYTDDISDYYGIQSTLYEDIAREISRNSKPIFYGTEQITGGALGKPLGEWP